MPEEKKSKSGINDTWIFVFLYPAISFFVVHIGNNNTFSELVKIPSFYSDLLLAFICSFGLGIYFRILFKEINRRFPEKEFLKMRLVRHLSYGILIPLIFIGLIEGVYLHVIGFGIFHPPFFSFDLPISFIFLVLINLIYLFLFEYGRKDSEPELEIRTEGFLVSQGRRKILIHHDQIVYFFTSKGSTWLITRAEEKYLMHESLSAVYSLINTAQFFQLNRKLIANRNSIRSYTPTSSRKLLVELDPPHTEEVFVSKPKSSDFINWFRN